MARGRMNLLTVSYTAGALLPDTMPALANRRPTKVDTSGPLSSLPTLMHDTGGFTVMMGRRQKFHQYWSACGLHASCSTVACR